MNAPWTPSIATAASPMQVHHHEGGPDGAASRPARPDEDRPSAVWAAEDAGTSRGGVRPGEEVADRTPERGRGHAPGTQARRPRSAASVSGRRLATMQVQATGASRRRSARPHGPDAVEGARAGRPTRAGGGGSVSSPGRRRRKCTTSTSSAVRTPRVSVGRRATEDTDDLGDLVDGAARASTGPAAPRHRLAEQRRLDAEERGAAGTEHGRGQQRHRRGSGTGRGAHDPAPARPSPASANRRGTPSSSARPTSPSRPSGGVARVDRGRAEHRAACARTPAAPAR